MTDEVEKLSGKLGIDTTDFKTAIGAANREIRVLESSFKASAASLNDWTRDASGLEARVKTLTGQIDIQKLKVEALRAEHQRLVEANGENSRAAQDAEIKLNKETETLNKMTLELSDTNTSLDEMKKGEEEAGSAAQAMGEDVEESGSKVETFKSILGGAGQVTKGFITGVLAVATAAITAVAALGGLGLNAASTAEGIADLSNQTGISATRIQEMKYAGEILGTSLDTITGANARLIRSMAGAQDQSESYAEKIAEAARAGKDIEDIELGDGAKAFETLGVAVTDVNGNLRDNQTVFAETIDALGRIENPAERDALAMQIFGKSAQELNPLIKAGADEMARLSEEAHTMGAVLSEEDVAAGAAFQDQLDGLKMGFQGVLAQIGLAFIPGLSGIADQAKGYLGELVGVVQGSGGDVGAIADGLGGLLGRIVTDLAAQAPQMLQVGLGLIQSIIGSITGALPTLLPAATSLLTSLIQFIVSNLPLLIGAGVPILLALVDAIVTNLPMLIDAALQAIIALANGLSESLPTLIPAIVEAVILIVNTLVENVPMLVDAALALILGLAEGLVAAIPILIPAIPQIVQAIFTALVAALPMIGQAAVKLLQTLAGGIVANLPLIGSSAVQLVDALVRGINNLYSSLTSVGANIVKSVWDGIVANAGWFFDQIGSFFTDIVDTAEEALGIASPSKKGKAIGRNFMGSVAVGGMEAMQEVERVFMGMTGNLAVAAANGLSGAQSNVNSTSNRFDIFGNVIMQGSTTPESFGSELMAKRY
jgi:phage-related protein